MNAPSAVATSTSWAPARNLRPPTRPSVERAPTAFRPALQSPAARGRKQQAHVPSPVLAEVPAEGGRVELHDPDRPLHDRVVTFRARLLELERDLQDRAVEGRVDRLFL